MLVRILGALFWNSFGGLSLDVFTKMTAPPGGLSNSIVGSLIQTALGLVISAPLGVLGGTYLAAECGRYSRVASAFLRASCLRRGLKADRSTDHGREA